MNSSLSNSYNDADQRTDCFEKAFIEEFGEPASKDYTWTDGSNTLQDAAFDYVKMENFAHSEGYIDNFGVQSPHGGFQGLVGTSPVRLSTLHRRLHFDSSTSPRAHMAENLALPGSTAGHRSQSFPTTANTPILDFDITQGYNNANMSHSQLYDSTIHHPSQHLGPNISHPSTYDSYFNAEFDASRMSIYSTPDTPQTDTQDFRMSGSDTSGPELSVPSGSTRRIGHGNDVESTVRRISRSSIPTVESEHLEKRRVQNRNSQRAFRERKASYINDLENQLSTLQTKYDLLLECSRNLRSAYSQVEKLLESKGVVHTVDKNNFRSGCDKNGGKRRSGESNLQ